MRGIWYGDRRDRVKWGGLILLAKRFDVATIVQIAMLRDSGEAILETDRGEEPMPDEVWRHFSDLQRIRGLETDPRPCIEVIASPFDAGQRSAYFAKVVRTVVASSPPRIAFVDPDTGIGYSNAGPKHVRPNELTTLWGALVPGDLLAVYQHADRTRSWLPDRTERLRSACGKAPVRAIRGLNIARDVALLWCVKESHNHLLKRARPISRAA